jgi:hypothetical protein
VYFSECGFTRSLHVNHSKLQCSIIGRGQLQVIPNLDASYRIFRFSHQSDLWKVFLFAITKDLFGSAHLVESSP